MKHKQLQQGFIWSICLLISTSNVQAAQDDRPSGLPTGTAMVCQTEQAIGFRWVGGKWKSSDFIGDSHIIEKLDAGKAGTGQSDCRQMPEGGVIVEMGRASVLGCYAIRRQSQRPDEARTEVCLESLTFSQGRWQVLAVRCEKFRFRPDGWFHRTSLHSDLDDRPERGEKDPLSVAVGHCRISQ